MNVCLILYIKTAAIDSQNIFHSINMLQDGSSKFSMQRIFNSIKCNVWVFFVQFAVYIKDKCPACGFQMKQRQNKVFSFLDH